jgi:hypothetical protein
MIEQRVYRSEWFSNGVTATIDAVVLLPDEAEGWDYEQTHEYAMNNDRWTQCRYEISDANGNRLEDMPDYPVYVTHVEQGLN